MKKQTNFLLALALLLTGCSMPGVAAPTPTASPSPSATATLTHTPSLTPTATVTETPTITPTPTIMPTIEPMTGILRAPTNIREKPSKGGSERLGGLYFNLNSDISKLPYYDNQGTPIPQP